MVNERLQVQDQVKQVCAIVDNAGTGLIIIIAA